MSLPLPGKGVRLRSQALPGLPLGLTITFLWVGLLVVVPLAALIASAAELGPAGLWHSLAQTRVLHALELSFGAALIASLIDLPLGLLLAFVLVRRRFPGRLLLDSLMDLPFALPTAVAGITLVTLFAPTGWIGAPLAHWGITLAYDRAGIVVALIFIGLPFMVRTVQPVLLDLPVDIEEAAAILGANAGQTIRRVLLPAIAPSLVAGFALAFARALGEYGSVIFIAGNLPNKTEIAPLLIVTRLLEFNDSGAAAIGFAMLTGALLVLLALGWGGRALRPEGFR
jgi:sulfate transport system permease protein